jgi:uncharacterized protein
MMNLFEDDELAVAVIGAIRRGELDSLRHRLGQTPGLATATITRRACSNSPAFSYPLIGAATDWPGHFPNISATIGLLVAAGADVNARAAGPHRETPLHGAASSDDLEALDALLDAGADIEAPGAVIAGGTALDDAVAFAQWQAARRLVQRGARTAVWHAAALGLLDRVEEYFASGMPAAPYPWGARDATLPRDVTVAFWCACHGGQRLTAEHLLARGAELSWVSTWDGLTPLAAARRSGASDVVEWLEALGATSAES